MNGWGFVAIQLGLVACVVLLGVNPRWRLSRFMFKSRGPRSDVECLTRRQLFAEGVKYLYLAVIAFLLLWIVAGIADAMRNDLEGSAPVMGATFILGILMAIFVLAGIYMLVRGVFRSSRYVPPPHCGQVRAAPPRA